MDEFEVCNPRVVEGWGKATGAWLASTFLLLEASPDTWSSPTDGCSTGTPIGSRESWSGGVAFRQKLLTRTAVGTYPSEFRTSGYSAGPYFALSHDSLSVA